MKMKAALGKVLKKSLKVYGWGMYYSCGLPLFVLDRFTSSEDDPPTPGSFIRRVLETGEGGFQDNGGRRG